MNDCSQCLKISKKNRDIKRNACLSLVIIILKRARKSFLWSDITADRKCLSCRHRGPMLTRWRRWGDMHVTGFPNDYSIHQLLDEVRGWCFDSHDASCRQRASLIGLLAFILFLGSIFFASNINTTSEASNMPYTYFRSILWSRLSSSYSRRIDRRTGIEWKATSLYRDWRDIFLEHAPWDALFSFRIEVRRL